MGQRGTKEATVYLAHEEKREAYLPVHGALNPPLVREQLPLPTDAERILALEDALSMICKRVAVLEATFCVQPGQDGQPLAANDTVVAIRGLLERRGHMAPLRERLDRETLENLRALCLLSSLPVSGAKAELVERLAVREVDPIYNDLADYKKEDLRAACADAGLPISGNKFELARRLVGKLR